MNGERPDPDALLAKVEQAAAKAKRGRLKIFFGASAGVGKTYAMLQAAHARKAEGVDVVAGYIEAHKRPETSALLLGLEQIPPKIFEENGVSRIEFDVDTALKRHPALILVDELAHTNVPGSRHPKRHQDVEDLLAAGINVYTTVNVQHLESLNDVIAQVTGVAVRETIPDKLLETADEVELIDLPADDLLQRLHEGKIYMPEQAKLAIESFFRKGNLMALRELALRSTADRVDSQMRDYREDHFIDAAWPVRDRLMVCIGSGPLGEQLIRAGKRMAASLKAEWIVVYVETLDRLRLPEAERESIVRNLRLAETLGAKTAILTGGRKFSEEVLDYAHAHNVSRIVVGKPRRAGWRRWIFGSVVDAIVEGGVDIDVMVISGKGDANSLRTPLLTRSSAYLGVAGVESRASKRRWPDYIRSVAITTVCTLVAWMLSRVLEPTNMVMIYLLGVVAAAANFSRGPAMLNVILGVLAFDFFFIPPYFSFTFFDPQYAVTFGVMLVVGMVISSLTADVRLQARVAGHREQRTAALYAMTRELSITRDQEDILKGAVHHVAEVFDCQAVILLPGRDSKLVSPTGNGIHGSLHGADLSVAQWVFDHGEPAGLGTDTLPGTDTLFLPMLGGQRFLGVLAVLPANPRRMFLPEQMQLLETFAGQIAVALDRQSLASVAQSAELKAQNESLRNSLLSAISHDLRTPLAVIAGSSSSLVEGGEALNPSNRHDMARNIYDEAMRMTRMVNNILDMTRLESGAVKLDRQLYPLEEIVGSVLNRMRTSLKSRKVDVDLPLDLPLLRVDGVLIEEVLFNLIENAIKYGGEDTPIRIAATTSKNEVTVTVEDNGPGFPAGAEESVFEKFYRGRAESAARGTGLGSTICRAIVQAHGGRIWAKNNPHGGATVGFTLPAEAMPADLMSDMQS